MRYLRTLAGACAIFGLAGCASTPDVAVLTPVSPAPAEGVKARRDGFLQVYSARKRAFTDLNTEEFLWNNDFGKNDFLYHPAHTDYDILSEDGKLVQHVTNARDINDPHPALVPLPPGTYKLHAKAEDYGTARFTAVVPVVIHGGTTTAAHLDEEPWKPTGPYDKSDLVRLPDGRIVGWQAGPVNLVTHAQ